MYALEDCQVLPDIQYGSRALRTCHTAVLNKVLTYEIHRYRKQPFAYIENDAMGCHEHIINPLVLLFLRNLGLSPNAAQSLATQWEKPNQQIKKLNGFAKKKKSKF